MRHMIRNTLPWLKWPAHIATFAFGFAHHLAAFFAWAWLALHVAVPLGAALFQVNFIKTQGFNFFGSGGVNWRGLLALALIPAIAVSVRQAYLSARKIPHRHAHEPRPSPMMALMTSPTRLGLFAASLAHHTAAFFGWVWLLAGLVGAIGTTGYSLARGWDYALRYFEDMGGQQWLGLLALAAIPSALFAFWNTTRSWRQLHAWAHERHEARHAGTGV